MAEAPPLVFISYSHDSAEHRDRVVELADRLRADGNPPRVGAVEPVLEAFASGDPNQLALLLGNDLQAAAVSLRPGLRRTLRGRAIADLKKAVTEYRAALAAPKHPDDELWRLAAETDLRDARDLLVAAGEK